MARINVEQIALTDSRFSHLGLIIAGRASEDADLPLSAIGIGLMVYIWNECQEQACYALPAVSVDMIGYQMGLKCSLSSAVVQCGLGEKTRSIVRIKGTEGRVEWLQQSRISGRERQKRYRERNAVTNDEVTRESRVPPAPAPAPAPTSEEKTKTSSNPPLADVDTLSRAKPRNGKHPDPETLRLFGLFYEDYPRHEGKQAALKAWVKLSPDDRTMLAIAQDMEHRLEDGRWLPDDPERVKFIPLPASYLNGRRWEDGLS